MLEGYSQRQIAKRLNCGEATIRRDINLSNPNGARTTPSPTTTTSTNRSNGTTGSPPKPGGASTKAKSPKKEPAKAERSFRRLMARAPGSRNSLNSTRPLRLAIRDSWTLP